MSWKYYPKEFSSYEEYVEYLKEKGLALEAPEADSRPRKGLVDIEKACEWLENNMHDYFDGDNEFAVCDCFLTKENFIEEFRKAMEE